MTKQPTVLFLCVHNSGRSQMGAGLLEQRAAGKVRVLSAGSAPGEALNPMAVAAMAELGIDITAASPTKLTDAMAREADVVVTMGCGDACPVYPGKRYLDWELEDPAGKDLDFVRGVRDEIARRVEQLATELLS